MVTTRRTAVDKGKGHAEAHHEPETGQSTTAREQRAARKIVDAESAAAAAETNAAEATAMAEADAEEERILELLDDDDFPLPEFPETVAGARATARNADQSPPEVCAAVTTRKRRCWTVKEKVFFLGKMDETGLSVRATADLPVPSHRRSASGWLYARSSWARTRLGSASAAQAVHPVSPRWSKICTRGFSSSENAGSLSP